MATIERRRYPRLSLDAGVEYRKIIPEAESFTTGSKNISSGGLCIILFERLNPEDLLELRLSVPGLNPIMAKGRVVWINELSIKDKRIDKIFEAGVEFTHIADKEKERIQQYVIQSIAHQETRNRLHRLTKTKAFLRILKNFLFPQQKK